MVTRKFMSRVLDFESERILACCFSGVKMSILSTLYIESIAVAPGLHHIGEVILHSKAHLQTVRF